MNKALAGEPKVWFTSAESLARVLSDRNRALLGIIAASAPESLTRLSELTGRKKSNLSRTLKDHGAVWLRATQPGSAGVDHPKGSVPDDLVDATVVQTGIAGDRSRLTGSRGRPGDHAIEPGGRQRQRAHGAKGRRVLHAVQRIEPA